MQQQRGAAQGSSCSVSRPTNFSVGSSHYPDTRAAGAGLATVSRPHSQQSLSRQEAGVNVATLYIDLVPVVGRYVVYPI